MLYILSKIKLCTKEKSLKCDLHSRIPIIKSLHIFFYFCTHSITVLVYDLKAPIKALHNYNKKTSLRRNQNNLCILNEDNKKNVGHFGFFANEMECERGKQDFSNKVIVLNATSVLIFQYINARKTTFKKYYTIIYFNNCKGKSANGIADMFSLKIGTVYNSISRAEKEGRLDL